MSSNNTSGLEDLSMSTDMFVSHLISGFACLNFFSTFSCDVDLVRGKVGCRSSAFLLYFGCRYFSVLSMVTMLIYNDVYFAAAIQPLNLICQGTASLSLGFAYTIMAVRIYALFPNVYFGIGLQLFCLALWALLFTGIRDIARPWTPHFAIHTAISIMMLLMSTGGLTLTAVHAFYLCRHEHHFNIRACWRAVWKDNVPEFALIWLISVPGTVVFYLNKSTVFWHHFAITYSSFVIVTVTSCRLYRTMLQRFDVCPGGRQSNLFGWIRTVAVFIASLFRSDDDWFERKFLRRSASDRVHHHTASGRTVSFAAPGLRHGGRRRSESSCIPANSRTTYAHSSLYDSREAAT